MPKGVYDHGAPGERRHQADLAQRQEMRRDVGSNSGELAIKARVQELRRLLYEAEQHCQAISSILSAGALPAGKWLFVDAARMSVLASMRCAQLLQLEIARISPPPPAAGG